MGFLFQMLLLGLLGMAIGLSLGFLVQFLYARNRQRRHQIAAYREQWRHYSERQLEDILARPAEYLPDTARKAACQLLSERRQLVS